MGALVSVGEEKRQVEPILGRGVGWGWGHTNQQAAEITGPIKEKRYVRGHRTSQPISGGKSGRVADFKFKGKAFWKGEREQE